MIRGQQEERGPRTERENTQGQAKGKMKAKKRQALKQAQFVQVDGLKLSLLSYC